MKGYAMKQCYSIEELVDITEKDAFNAVSELKASGADLFCDGKPADLSQWKSIGPSKDKNGAIRAAITGRCSDPHPSRVMVASNTLPPLWKELIIHAEQTIPHAPTDNSSHAVTVTEGNAGQQDSAAKVCAVPGTALGEEQKPWLIADPNDPESAQSWYTPARYFARQLVIEDSTLLIKRDILADKVCQSLKKAGIFKRGGKKPFSSPDTIKKAFANVRLG